MQKQIGAGLISIFSLIYHVSRIYNCIYWKFTKWIKYYKYLNQKLNFFSRQKNLFWFKNIHQILFIVLNWQAGVDFDFDCRKFSILKISIRCLRTFQMLSFYCNYYYFNSFPEKAKKLLRRCVVWIDFNFWHYMQSFRKSNINFGQSISL